MGGYKNIHDLYNYKQKNINYCIDQAFILEKRRILKSIREIHGSVKENIH